MQGKYWCITSFSDLQPPQFDEAKMKYMCFQQEECKKGTLHWQCYVECYSNMRLKAIKEAIGDEAAHCELRRGSREQAREYCRKAVSAIKDSFEEFGEWEGKDGQGKRNDLLDACRLGNVEDIKTAYPGLYVRYSKGFEKLIKIPVRTAKPLVTVLWSNRTGVGKSLGAEKIGKENKGDTHWKMHGKWWEGYNGEKTVIIDDFDPDEYSVGFMLRLLDRYPMKVEWKGGSREFTSPNVVITSHFDPRSWYGARNAEIIRRIDVVKEVGL